MLFRAIAARRFGPEHFCVHGVSCLRRALLTRRILNLAPQLHPALSRERALRVLR